MTRALLVLCLAVLLGGCAIIRKPPRAQPGVVDAAAWIQHKRKLDDFNVWSLQGRVATGQLLGWTGNLSWRQRARNFDVRLSGPLGAGGFRADGTLGRVVIHTKDRTMVTRDPDVLVRKTLGWTFPLEPLRYWVKGVPAPGDYNSISVNAEGRMIALDQRGWRLSLTGYEQPHGAPAVPGRIVLDNGDTRIRLVVDRWFDVKAAAAN